MPKKERNSGEDNNLGSEKNNPSLRENNLASQPEGNSFVNEFLSQKETEAKDFSSEDNRFFDEKPALSGDQKGGNPLKSTKIIKVIASTAVSASAIAISVVAVTNTLLSRPTIESNSYFSSGGVEINLKVNNPDAIDLSVTLEGLSNSYFHEEKVTGEKGEASYSYLLSVPDLSRYQLKVKGNQGFGSSTFYSSTIIYPTSGLFVTGDSFLDAKGDLDVSFLLSNPNNYSLALEITKVGLNKSEKLPLVSLPSETAYESSFHLGVGYGAEVKIVGSKGYLSETPYFSSVAYLSPLDLGLTSFGDYLVVSSSPIISSASFPYTLHIKDEAGKEIATKSVSGGSYENTFSAPSGNRYWLSAVLSADDNPVTLSKVSSVDASAPLSGLSLKGMNASLFMSYSELTSAFPVYLGIKSKEGADLLKKPLENFSPNETYCFDLGAGSSSLTYESSVSVALPKDDGTAIEVEYATSEFTLDSVNEPSVVSSSRYGDGRFFYSASESYSSSANKADFKMRLEAFDENNKALNEPLYLSSLEGGSHGILTLKANAISYEIIGETPYGDKIYYVGSCATETGLLSHVYGSVYASESEIRTDLKMGASTLGATYDFSSNAASLAKGALTSEFDERYDASTYSLVAGDKYSFKVESEELLGSKDKRYEANLAYGAGSYVYFKYFQSEISPDECAIGGDFKVPSGTSVSLTSVGLSSGTEATYEPTLSSSVFGTDVYSLCGKVKNNGEDQKIEVVTSSGEVIAHSEVKCEEFVKPSVTSKTISGSSYDTYFNVPTSLEFDNPLGIPLEVSTVPYKSDGTIIAANVQTSSVDSPYTSYSNTDTVVDLTDLDHVVVEVKAVSSLGGEVYFTSDPISVS